MHPHSVRWTFNKLTKGAAVKPIRFHDIRHTHATLGLAAGIPVKVMSERLGHASTAITADLYMHVVGTMGSDAAATIGDLLRGAS